VHPEHHNAPASACIEAAKALGITVTQPRTVTTGDWVLAEDWNTLVDCYNVISSAIKPPLPPWTLFIDFNNWIEAWYLLSVDGASLTDSILSIPSGSDVWYQLNAKLWNTIEVKMRVKNIYDISSGINWFYVYSHPGSGIGIKFDPDTSKLVLTDSTSGNSVTFDLPKDWFVIRLECPPDKGGHVKVYDASTGAVIAEMDLAFYSGGYEEYMEFYTQVTLIDVDVEYIGFYSDTYTPPPVPPMPEPSGIDPYNPLWLPSKGWSYVYHFESMDDVNSLFYNWSQVYVLNSNAVLLPRLQTYGWAEYITSWDVYTRIAIALRFIINNYGTANNEIMKVSQSQYKKPSRSVTIYSDTANNPHGVIINDDLGGTRYPWTPTEDYVVAVFDYPASGTGSLTIYDKYGNILFQQQLTERLGSLYQFVLRFTSRNASIYSTDTDAPGQHIIYIDWIALKEI
jgi:hypothetical protein